MNTRKKRNMPTMKERKKSVEEKKKIREEKAGKSMIM